VCVCVYSATLYKGKTLYEETFLLI